MNKDSFTKSDSKIIYGIAILMMIFHHMFCFTSNGDYSFINRLFGAETDMRLAWLCRLCIPFFSFVSGYGLCRIASANTVEGDSNINLKTRICSTYKLVIKQIFKLLKKYWLVMVLFVPLGLKLGVLSPVPILNTILTIVGIDCSYIADWWYVGQYMWMLLLFPVIDILFILCRNAYCKHIQKSKAKVCILWGVIGVLAMAIILLRNTFLFSTWLVPLLRNGRFTFFMVFIVGYLCAALNLFSVFSDKKNYNLVSAILSVLLLALCLYIRWIRASYSTYCKYDAFITAPIIFSVITLIKRFRIPTKALQFIGAHSTYMWLTHRLLILLFLQRFVIDKLHYTIIVYPITVLTALAVSIVIEFVVSKVKPPLRKH